MHSFLLWIKLNQIFQFCAVPLRIECHVFRYFFWDGFYIYGYQKRKKVRKKSEHELKTPLVMISEKKTFYVIEYVFFLIF